MKPFHASALVERVQQMIGRPPAAEPARVDLTRTGDSRDFNADAR